MVVKGEGEKQRREHLYESSISELRLTSRHISLFKVKVACIIDVKSKAADILVLLADSMLTHSSNESCPLSSPQDMPRCRMPFWIEKEMVLIEEKESDS
jgi:hypothetical protein